MAAVHVTVWDDREQAGGGRAPTASRAPVAPAAAAAPALFIHNIFTWGSDSTYGFAAQRPLADSRQLLLMDRRGYGDSPDTARSDFDIDTEDAVEVLGDGARAVGPGGAHLVGHGNGAVAALLATARRPDLVRSLALIQPSAFTAAAHHPVVAGLLDRVRDGAPGIPDGVTPEQYLRASTEGLGMAMPEPTPRRLRAVATSMRERPIWEAEIPLEVIRGTAVPILVICGTWEHAPVAYREHVGLPLMAVAESLTDSLGGRLLRVPGYYPHTQEPATVNAALRELWA
ncbi:MULTISPECIES: alpha/beta fold hydrolase [Streptomyces]|uniref:Alpha/beta hydrolase n=2 Tax=Streptomyces rimosus subsp. rimosus TaxID=132474 RepID=L8EW89_STRR1|nr:MULTISPECIES: alpha/beta hydrolase [Streptomyces]KOG73434.1 alpha/beta hydrolase [Kitasatospora aureofaciens]MYT45646.1 alpha/beta fold hydrolase [Streptomyces sp. SID5471]KOT39664.1 alpha/beta hydrolase [Streptomyces rimosus subsp. rimosus]KOT39903.1 alpha/beta hydrolase [Streptomyces sp. NRRL WC-3701]KOT56634.1 alpha/beta hydrolase [Streptomyces rimosus subsp. rimosus]